MSNLFGFPQGLSGGSKETSYSTLYSTNHTTNYNTSHTTYQNTSRVTNWNTSRSTSKTTNYNSVWTTNWDTNKTATVYNNIGGTLTTLRPFVQTIYPHEATHPTYMGNWTDTNTLWLLKIRFNTSTGFISSIEHTRNTQDGYTGSDWRGIPNMREGHYNEAYDAGGGFPGLGAFIGDVGGSAVLSALSGSGDLVTAVTDMYTRLKNRFIEIDEYNQFYNPWATGDYVTDINGAQFPNNDGTTPHMLPQTKQISGNNLIKAFTHPYFQMGDFLDTKGLYNTENARVRPYQFIVTPEQYNHFMFGGKWIKPDGTLHTYYGAQGTGGWSTQASMGNMPSDQFFWLTHGANRATQWKQYGTMRYAYLCNYLPSTARSPLNNPYLDTIEILNNQTLGVSTYNYPTLDDIWMGDQLLAQTSAGTYQPTSHSTSWSTSWNTSRTTSYNSGFTTTYPTTRTTTYNTNYPTSHITYG